MATAISRPDIVVVGREGCGWCKKLKAEVADIPHFYLDAEQAMGSDDAEKTKSLFVTTVDGMPTTFTLDHQSQTYKVTCTGYLPRDQWYEKVRPRG
jgi:thioredoxin-related protein